MKPTDLAEWTNWYPSGDEQVRGTVGELLVRIASHQPRRRLPPYRVLEDIVRRGQIGGGMGGGLQWSPAAVVLSEALFEEIRNALPREQTAESCELDLTSLEEWQAWCFERDHGLDYSEHLKRLQALREAELAKDRHLENRASAAYQQALSDYLDFVSRNLGQASEGSSERA